MTLATLILDLLLLGLALMLLGWVQDLLPRRRPEPEADDVSPGWPGFRVHAPEGSDAFYAHAGLPHLPTAPRHRPGR